MRSIEQGRTELVDLLGEGGMAAVFRAFDHQEGAWRAVKLMSPTLVRSPALRERFFREAEVSRALVHPRIGQVIRAGMEGETPFLVMELVEGRNLMAWVHAYGPMPPKMAVDAALQVASALLAAHAVGVIHRDVKPDNVLVAQNGTCKLVDFGIARMEDAISTTRTGVMMGSRGYMAPEQETNAKEADERADVHALAVMVAALINGADPVPRDGALERFAGRVPGSLAMPIFRATATDRKLRTPSVDKLAQGLQRALEDLDEPPKGTPTLHIPLPPARRAP